MQTSMPELPGYEALEKLGDDGIMTLWKARQLSLDRFVTIKVLSVDTATNTEALAHLRHEAMAAAKLKNPGIVQIYDTGEFGSLAYIVMEYIAGSTVQEQLNLLSVMPEEEALAIIQWVALALQYAWSGHRIIHCDIKPENIILSDTGDVRVGNLGIAQVINAMSCTGSAGDFIGTPNYASPEYVGGKEQLDCRADIYSLGATFYQLVTGVLPFDGLEPAAILEQQLLGHLEDPRDLNPNLSDSATAIIHKMMARSLNDRYSDWRELLNDLRALKKGQPLEHAPCPKGHSTVRLSHPLNLPAAPAPKQQASADKAITSTKKQIRISKADLGKTNKAKSSGRSGCLAGILFLLLMGTGLFAASRYTSLGPVFREYLDRALTYVDYYLYGVNPKDKDIQSPPAATASASSPAPAAQAILPNQQPAASGSSSVTTQPANWKTDPAYQQSLQLYKEARGLYDEYISARKNPQLLTEAEAKCREAIGLLKACRSRLPPQAGIQPMIDQCFHLISDCHHARPLDL